MKHASDRIRAPRWRLRRTIVAWPLIASLPLLPFNAVAELPTGGQVSAGRATIGASVAGSMVVNQASQRAVVRWNDFTLGQGNTLTFQQPNARASILNIATGQNASLLAGTLQANGSVFLVNPNGITITPTGRIAAQGGFVAATLGIGEDDFMAGRLRFQGRGGSVVNQGDITVGSGGFAALLGAAVSNEGVIRAPLGKVALGAAMRATLDLAGDGFLQVALPADALSADGRPLINQSGRIEADGGIVLLKAAAVRDAVRDAVYMPGEIRARSVSGQDGAIVLEGGGGQVTVTGKLDASADTAAGGTRGGRIDASGDSLVLKGAEVLASGPQRGGLVRLGGGFQGGRPRAPGSRDATIYIDRFPAAPALANAQTTSIDAGSRIDVSSAQGVGGTVIVWSDGSTVMDGAVGARGAASGGAVEISAKSQIQSVALHRLDLGAGGTLLLDPKNIVISGAASAVVPGSEGFATNAGNTTQLNEGALVTLLGTGTTVNLMASNDITWNNGFAFVSPPAVNQPAGDLNLSAGRSLRLAGVFNTGMGNWQLVANAKASTGVVEADRDLGAADLNLRGANFINSNGNLSLLLDDGAGRAANLRGVGSLGLGAFTGNSLTAEISPTAVSEFPGSVPRMLLGYVDGGIPTIPGNIRVSGPLSLTATNIRLTNQTADTLTYTSDTSTVTWTNEKTGGVLSGEGRFKWVQGTSATRFGRLGGSAAVRLELGDEASASAFSRPYGDADPNAAGVGTPLVRLAAHNVEIPADALASVLAPSSLTVTGPGVTAPAGASSLGIAAAPGFDLAQSGYFVDLTTATKPMTIVQRLLTPSTASGSYVYGSPASVTTLANIVNGDSVQAVATLNGTTGVALEVNGAGFGFNAKTPAGNALPFTVTGLSGSAAANYIIDGGTTTGSVTITPRPLRYFGLPGSNIYGTLGTLPTVGFNDAGTSGGPLVGDNLIAVGGLRTSGGLSAALAPRLAAGSYSVDVVGIAGTAAANYMIATAGNAPGSYTVDRKALGFSVTDANSTYGTLALLGTATLTGIEAADTVAPGPVSLAGGVPLTARTPAGSYAEVITSLTGAHAANYIVGAGSGTLTVARKPINYTGSNLSQPYGQFAIVEPTLTGVVGGDTVTPMASVLGSTVTTSPGESGHRPLGDHFVGLTGITGADAGNYSLLASGNTDTRITVTAKPLQFQLVGGTSATVYGTAATRPTITLSGIVSGDDIGADVDAFRAGVTASIGERTAAGSYDWGVGRITGTGAGNYVMATTGNTAATLTVARRPINYSVASGPAVYGDSISNPVTLATVLTGDIVVPTLTAFAPGNMATARPVVGTAYTAAVTALGGAQSGNYAIAATGNTPGALSITPRPVTWSVANVISTYGDQATPGAVTLQNVLPGDTVAPTQAARQNGADITLQPRTPAGGYQQVVTAVGNANYLLATAGHSEGALTIVQRQLTYAVANGSSVYGSAAALPADAALTGLLAGDDVRAQSRFAQPFLDYSAFSAGAYPNVFIAAGLTGAQAANYTYAATGSTPGALTIARKPINYMLDLRYGAGALGNSVVYGEVVNGPGFTLGPTFGQEAARPALSGVLARDDGMVGMEVTPPTIPFSSSGNLYQVGSYAWTGGALTGSRASNYVVAPIGNRDVTLQITPRPLLIRTAVDGQFLVATTETYGEADQHEVRTLFQPLGTDQVLVGGVFATPSSGVVARLPARAPVGTYTTGLGGPLAGADARNYTAQHEPGPPLVMAPKLISWQIADTRFTYGQQPTISGVTFSGVLSGDTVTASTSATTPGGTLQVDTPAGRYAVTHGPLMGDQAANYVVRELFWQTDGSRVQSRSGSLLIDRKTLNYTPAPGSLAITYGETVTLPSTLGGVLFNDDVRAAPMVSTASGVVDLTTSLRLNAGSYPISRELAGTKSGNYLMEPRSDAVQVAKRLLTMPGFVDRSTPYGTFVGIAPTAVGNVVPGDTVSVQQQFFAPGIGLLSYSDRTDAGRYTEFVNIGAASANYTIPRSQVTLTVNPKDLSIQTVSNPSLTYGDSAKLASLTGVLFGDDVGLKALLPSGTTSRLAGNAAGDQSFTQPVDIGTYTLPLSLDGGKTHNYRAPAASSTFTVNPRNLLYTVANVQGEYGAFLPCADSSSCTSYQPGLALGAASFQGVLPGDVVTGTVTMLDLAGQPRSLDGRLPVGRYLQVVSALAGRSAGNYRVPASGSLPGVLELTPTPYYWTTESALYVHELGLVGNGGAATVFSGGRGADGKLNGSLLNGDTVTPVVQLQDGAARPVAIADIKADNRYFFAVVGLQGEAAGNYRPIVGTVPALDRPRNEFVRTPDGVAINTKGTLDVYASPSVGLVLVPGAPPAPVVGTVPAPAPTPIPSPAPAPTTTPTTAPTPTVLPLPPPVQAPALSTWTPYYAGVDTRPTTFGRNTVATGVDGGYQVGPTGVAASGIASAATQTSTQVGASTLSAQASTTADALARFGVTGVSVVANAGAHADINFDVGPGYVMFGVQSDVRSESRLSVTGVVLTSDATAGAYTRGGVGGSLGGAGTGSVSGTTGVFAYARSDNRYTLGDGKVGFVAEQAIGVGASAGGTGSIAGSAGRVDAGVTVYTPGSLGGKFQWNAGVGDGKLAIGLDLGAQIGIGGLGVNIAFEIDFAGTGRAIDTGLQAIANDPVMRSIGNEIGSWIGVPRSPPPPPSAQQQAARAAAEQKVRALEQLKTDFADAVASQKRVQQTFLDLLKTDPQGAIAYSKSNAIFEAQRQYRMLVTRSGEQGLQLAVADGKLGLVAKK